MIIVLTVDFYEAKHRALDVAHLVLRHILIAHFLLILTLSALGRARTRQWLTREEIPRKEQILQSYHVMVVEEDPLMI